MNKYLNILKKIRMPKITMPLAILLGCAFIAIAFYLIQVDKRESIERQQAIERQQQALENERAELKIKQDECESLSVGARAKWNNVMGVTYDNGFWKDCVVTYTDTKTGKVETSPLKFMETVK